MLAQIAKLFEEMLLAFVPLVALALARAAWPSRWMPFDAVSSPGVDLLRPFRPRRDPVTWLDQQVLPDFGLGRQDG